MKDAVLGANWLLSAGATDHTVVPATGLPSPSVQVNAVPPHSCTSIPRCRLYQACSAAASLALKKMPPMPVTRCMEPPRWGGAEMEYVLCGPTINKRRKSCHYTHLNTRGKFGDRWDVFPMFRQSPFALKAAMILLDFSSRSPDDERISRLSDGCD